jgi:imidazolonepropionase-like amidohydrolase
MGTQTAVRRVRGRLAGAGFLKRMRMALTAVAALGAVAMVSSCNGAKAPEEIVVLKGFTLIDGTGGAAAPESAMIIHDGRISWVGAASELDAPAGARSVDLTGKYVMPGLIDLHVHLGNVKDMVQDGAFYSSDSVNEELGRHASYGVTTVVSMGTDNDQIFSIRDEQRRGRPDVARVYTSGQGLVFAGGYGGLAGLNHPVSTAAEAEAAVDAQAAKGVDIIKFWLDDELGSMPKMPADISEAIIRAAHRNNLRVVAHIFYLEDAQRLVDQGIDGLAHAVRDKSVDQKLLDSMKQRGVWQLAETLSREASMFAYGERAPFLDDPFFRFGASASSLEILGDPQRQATLSAHPHFHDYPEFLETAQKNLITMARAGVNYGFGTDAGPPGRFAGYFAHWELSLMVESGFTPAEAIATATGRAASFLGSTEVGLVQPGRWADLLVLNADPLVDISNSRKIHSVYIAGRTTPSVASSGN